MKGDDLPIIVMDVEWTAWEGSRARHWSGPGEEMEIVQLGAVKLTDTVGLPEIASFEVLVKPRINPNLDPYFIDLTGITQERLDRTGVDLCEAVIEFADFIGDSAEVFGFGNELLCIDHNCQLYGMQRRINSARGVNIRGQVIDHLDAVPRSVDSCHLPGLLKFEPPGAEHQALADSRCIAEALRRLRAIDKF